MSTNKTTEENEETRAKWNTDLEAMLLVAIKEFSEGPDGNGGITGGIKESSWKKIGILLQELAGGVDFTAKQLKNK